jgi:hypothetical protein
MPCPLLTDLGGFHYNTSLIYGTCQNLREATNQWEQLYKALATKVSHRHLEEIAFSLSATRSPVQPIPISKKVQGSFYSFDDHSSLFHFGGDSTMNQFLKNGFRTSSTVSFARERLLKPTKIEINEYSIINSTYSRSSGRS